MERFDRILKSSLITLDKFNINGYTIQVTYVRPGGVVV